MLTSDARHHLRRQVDSTVRRRLGLASAAINPKAKSGSRQSRWTESEKRECVRHVARVLGKDKITQAEYARFVAREDGTLFPSIRTVGKLRDEFAR